MKALKFYPSTDKEVYLLEDKHSATQWCFIQKGVLYKMFLKFSQNSLEKNCTKVLSCRGLRPAILLKKSLQLRCFL